METKNKHIGIVSNTSAEPSSENSFTFIVCKNENNNEDRAVLGSNDIVKVIRKLPSGGTDTIFASINAVTQVSDAPSHIANFISYNFGHTDKDIKYERLGFCQVAAKIIYSEDDVFYPLKTGEKVYLCDVEEVKKAIYQNFDKEKDKFVSVATTKMYRGDSRNRIDVPIMLRPDYLIGPKMAHLNFSGISGGAAKTTKAMIVLKCLYDWDPNTTVVIFNTKEQDLLNVHKITEDKNTLEDLAKLENGNSKWYENVLYLRPNQTNNEKRRDANDTFYVADFKTVKERNNLDMLTAWDLDESGTMDSCRKQIETDDQIKNWGEFNSEIEKKAKKSETSIQNNSWRKYDRMINRLKIKSSPLFRDEGDKDISSLVENHLNQSKIIVIDIEPLEMIQQAFVFGCVIRTIKEKILKLRNNNQRQKAIIFVDELNRYASENISPASPILESLIEISETGRSYGMCLMTAEQTLSSIHPRIKNNIATNIIGRTSALELSQPDFYAIPESVRQRIATFKLGDAVVISPTLNAGYITATFIDKFYKES